MAVFAVERANHDLSLLLASAYLLGDKLVAGVVSQGFNADYRDRNSSGDETDDGRIDVFVFIAPLG